MDNGAARIGNHTDVLVGYLNSVNQQGAGQENA